MFDKYRYVTFIIDVVNVLYRYSVKLKNKSDHAAEKELLHSFNSYITDLVSQYGRGRETQLVLLCDNFSSQVNRRKEINESYKATRTHDTRVLKAADRVMTYYRHVGERVFLAQYKKHEADDLVKPFLLSCNCELPALLVSTDMDWSRYIDYSGEDSVHWLAKPAEDPIDVSRFKHRYGFSPTESSVIAWKALKGDPSDGIHAAAPRLPLDPIIRLVEDENVLNYISVGDYSECDYISEELADKLNQPEVLKRIQENIQMVSPLDISEELWPLIFHQGSWDPTTLQNYWKMWGVFPTSQFTDKSLSEDTHNSLWDMG